jgi:hypothetical protein
MPAGSGPSIARATAVNVAAAEVVLAVTPAGSWNNPNQLGNLISASVNFTPGAAQTTTTLRIRQGNGVGGALVGIAHAVTTVAAAPIELAIQELDTSAFGNVQQAGQYTLTGQTNAAGPGTANAALIELETVAPLI